ncbi:TonB family protein [Marivita sp. S0852]|uniref:TonB family protein n=1 Tax=Marivita sp. S0852 TaxID=3373893 RepID=UPI003982C8B3
MIPRSPVWKILAASTALAAHGAFVLAVSAPEDIRVEAQRGSAEVKIGTGFADMAVGTLSAATITQDATDPAEPTPVSQTSPTKTDRVEHQQTTHARPAPMAPQPAPPQPAQQTGAALLPKPQVEAIAALRATAMLTQSTALQPTSPEAAPQPSAPDTPHQIETLTAEEEITAAPLASKRPQRRTKAFETAHTPKAAPKPKQQTTSRGNANRNATKGSSTGTRTATAARQGTAQGTAQSEGNAAASNYPGQVWSKLSRVRRPNGRGTARVQFSITASGDVASVSIASSSGNSRFDRAALQIVRRAGPFPRPPQGARRTYTFVVQGG